MKKNPTPPKFPQLKENGKIVIYTKLSQIREIVDLKSLSILVSSSRKIHIGDKIYLKSFKSCSSNKVSCLVSVVHVMQVNCESSYKGSFMIKVFYIGVDVS